MTDFWFNHFNVYIAKGADRWLTTSYERDAIRPYALGNFRDLLGAVAHHPAMLFYLDNWLSSVPGVSFSNNAMEAYADERIRDLGLPPGGVATLILRDRGMDTTAIEDHIQRRQGLNRYRRNAAMRPRSFDSQRDGQQPRRNGLNENYARELLELHTLGVDGGYTQQDVIEVARCFTGWTLAPMHAGQGFLFVPALHDDGKKVVLGKKIKGKGEAQGEAVLDLLATHPSTARFISTKLARRFVADDPPPALVERMAATFLQTDGEIKSVLSTMLRSEEFWSADALQAKVKTPFEFVVSAVRAVDAEIAGLPTGSPEEMAQMMSGRSARRSATGLLHALREMDQPLYGAEPPTGYEDTAADWISSGALLNRMKLSIGLAADRIPGVRVELDGVAVSQGESTDDAVARVGLRLLGRAPSDATVEAIARNIDAGPERLDELGLPRGFARSGEGRTKLTVGWLLASAEFQRK
jgi:uncharacterized protein (DUF1800 family)